MVTLLCLFVAVPAFAGTIQYTYDNAGRLTGADYGDSKTIAFTYDNNGNLLQRNTQTPLPGDINGDNLINMNDAIMALKVCVSIENESPINMAADVNKDNRIGISEVMFILKKIAKEELFL